MKVQLLQFSNLVDHGEWRKEAELSRGDNITYIFGEMAVNRLGEPADFDAFDVNIIRFDEQNFWKNSKGETSDKVDSLVDLEGIAKLTNVTDSTVVIALPHEPIRFSYKNRNSYVNDLSSRPIKDMLDSVLSIALSSTPHVGAPDGSIVCASGTTIIGNCELKSSFFLDGRWDFIVTSTKRPSLKPTTVIHSGVVLTTLPILQSEQALSLFLEAITSTKSTCSQPSWFEALPPMLDDEKWLQEIERQEEVIAEASAKAAAAKEHLCDNNELKSILYSNGNQLESVVRRILGELLDWDPGSFVDHGTSDFIINVDNIWFVGEIKGENSNVVNSHLTQLMLNYDLDVEAGRIPESAEVRRLLVANTFRKKPLDERPSIDEKQINLASRYGCLMVTTPVLLELYNAIRSGAITRNQAFGLLSRTGILAVEDVYD